MIKRVAGLAILLAVGGCLSQTSREDVTPKLREQAARYAGQSAPVFWQTALSDDNIEFIDEVGGDTVVVGQVDVAKDGGWYFGKIEGFDAATGEKLWKRERPGEGWQALGSSVIAGTPTLVLDHQLYSNKHTVYEGLDRRTGGKRWTHEIEADWSSAVDAAAGILVISEPGGTVSRHSVTAYSLETGKKLWSMPFSKSGVLKGKAPTVAVQADEVYVLGNELARLDAITGEIRWAVQLPFNLSGATVESNGRLAVVSGDGGSAILEVGSGKPVKPGLSGRNVKFVLFEDDRLVVADHSARPGGGVLDSRLTAFDSRTGQRLWHYPMVNDVESNFLIGQGKLIFATRVRIVSINLKSGKEMFSTIIPPKLNGWRPGTDDDPQISSPHIWLRRLERIGDKILVALENNLFLAFRERDGALLGRVPVPYPVKDEQDIRGIDSAYVPRMASARNGATIVQEKTVAGTLTAAWSGGALPAADYSASDKATAKSETVRRDQNSSSMDRMMAIAGAYNATAIDAAFARVSSTMALQSAAYNLSALIRAGQEAKYEREKVIDSRKRFSTFLHYFRRGLLMRYVSEPETGQKIVDIYDIEARQRTVLPVSVGTYYGDSAIAPGADGKRVYVTGYGYDPAQFKPVRQRSSYILPPKFLIAVDLTKAEPSPVAGPALEPINVTWEGEYAAFWKERGETKPCGQSYVGFNPNDAVYFGKTELLKECLRNKQRGVEDISLKYEPKGMPEGVTLLMIAAMLGDPRHVDILIEMGYDPATRNHLGATAADFARIGGHGKLEKKLRRLAGG